MFGNFHLRLSMNNETQGNISFKDLCILLFCLRYPSQMVDRMVKLQRSKAKSYLITNLILEELYARINYLLTSLAFYREVLNKLW